MKVYYDEIRNVYGIKVKLFEPDCDVNGYILALHGFCGDMESSVITRLAERMTAHGLAVVTFNFPGHGTSDADEYFSLMNCRNDMLTVIKYAERKYQEIPFTAVFATSFGGYVTLHNLDEIPLNTKIILRAPAVNMKSSFEKFVNDMDSFQINDFETIGFNRKLNVPYRFYTELENNYILDYDFDRAMMIIHGDCDDIVLPKDMEIFCHNNPLAKLNVITGANHRFNGDIELEQIINLAENYIMEG